MPPEAPMVWPMLPLTGKTLDTLRLSINWQMALASPRSPARVPVACGLIASTSPAPMPAFSSATDIALSTPASSSSVAVPFPPVTP